jgi:hypothetical protein
MPGVRFGADMEGRPTRIRNPAVLAGKAFGESRISNGTGKRYID